MWVSKDSETRKKEFLETAIALFIKKGYDVTSINDILKRINITKGSFYYHFQSKEDLVNQVVELFLADIYSITKTITSSSLGALEKLEAVYLEVANYRRENKKIYRDLYELLKKDGNHYIHSLYMQRVNVVYSGIIGDILRQGVEENVFEITDVEKTTEVFLLLMNLFKSKLSTYYYAASDVNQKDVIDIKQFYQQMLEKILGAEEGTLSFYGRM
ncbi:MAG: TetR/AcrR family transcriptional regulator [Firmicutes bacterium]|nr:TetR/AcrR family transcriptional regulator [Bacillota bacterium]